MRDSRAKMNTATWTIYRQYLDRVNDINDPAAAAALTLADTIRERFLDPPATTPQPEAALTVAEAAGRLKVAANTIFALVERGELKHHRIGRTIRILPADIDANQQAARPGPPQRKYGAFRL